MQLCQGVQVYLFKYVYKGYDKGRALSARNTAGDDCEHNRNEFAE